MTKRKQVPDPLDIRWNLDGNTLESAIAFLSELATQHGKDKRISIEAYEDYGSPSCNVVLELTRNETDKEMQARLKQEKVQNARTKKWEREQFERLSKKYGSK